MQQTLSAAWRKRFRQRLLDWYQQHGRALPWRQTHDPYAIWISEIMLQQTQVATVIGYFGRFLSRFPDIRSLAEAEEQEVLTYWAGLGYYRRARQLHAAAKLIVSDHAGVFPRELDAVRSLPGIGRYTAGAIVSFAYGTPAPIVEANTQRLFARLLGLRQDVKLASSQTQLWSFAESILPAPGSAVGLLNQATMELGSLVCLPKQPNCAACPAADLCSANLTNAQQEIPLASKPTVATPLTQAAVVIQRRGLTLLRQNHNSPWWNGLWDFPRVDVTSQLADSLAYRDSDQWASLDTVMRQQLDLHCTSTHFLKTFKHAVTRYRISLHCYAARLDSPSLSQQQIWKWIDLSSSPALPLTSTAEKLRKWLLTDNVSFPST